MNPSCFVVRRPDGFAGVEVECSDQLTPSEAREFAADLLRCSDEVDPPAPMWRVLSDESAGELALVRLESRDGRCRAELASVTEEVVQVSFEAVHAGGDALAGAWACDLAKSALERRYVCNDVGVSLRDASDRVVVEGRVELLGSAAMLVARGFFGLEVPA